MDIKWSYYLIIILYISIVILKYINKREHLKFKTNYQDVISYKVHKKDFFYTIAIICIAITLFINGTAFIGGRPLVISSFIITLLISGMAYLTGCIEVLATNEGMLVIDGTIISSNNVKEVVIKEKKSKTHYEILFEEPLNGYEGIAFNISGNNQTIFNEYIKTF